MRVQKTIVWLLALTPLLALFSCESDDMTDSQQGELVPVTIRLGVEGSGLTTRNSAEELDGEEAESNINTINVYIVASDGTEFILDEDDFVEGVATIQNMPTGEAHAYAVANYEDDAITQDNMQNSKITVNAIEKITDEHPYIPMSAKETWSVSSNQSEYQITLIRMVAKMHVTIYDQRKQTTTRAESNPSLTIEGLLPSKTNLHRLGIEQVDEPDGLVDSDYAQWEWTGINFAEIQAEDEDIETGLRAYSDAFYLHESEMKEFNLTYKEEEQDDRSGSFQTIIPRNRIFPLKIYLTDYHLDIDVKHSEPPIGVYPNPTPANGYNITLPAGCEFTITITPKKSKDNATWESDAAWSCEVTNNNFEGKNIFVLDEEEVKLPNNETITDSSYLSFSGYISAVEAQSGNITLTFTIKDGDAELTLPVVIQIGNLETKASPEAQPIIIEL